MPCGTLASGSLVFGNARRCEPYFRTMSRSTKGVAAFRSSFLLKPITQSDPLPNILPTPTPARRALSVVAADDRSGALSTTAAAAGVSTAYLHK